MTDTERYKSTKEELSKLTNEQICEVYEILDGISLPYMGRIEFPVTKYETFFNQTLGLESRIMLPIFVKNLKSTVTEELASRLMIMVKSKRKAS